MLHGSHPWWLMCSLVVQVLVVLYPQPCCIGPTQLQPSSRSTSCARITLSSTMLLHGSHPWWLICILVLVVLRVLVVLEVLYPQLSHAAWVHLGPHPWWLSCSLVQQELKTLYLWIEKTQFKMFDGSMSWPNTDINHLIIPRPHVANLWQDLKKKVSLCYIAL